MYKIFDLTLHGGPLLEYEKELNRLIIEDNWKFIGIFGDYCVLLYK